MGDEEKACAFYTQALKQMDPEERAVMESVEWIATEEEQEHIQRVERQRDRSDASLKWTDSLERVRFWRKQDPLFLTEFNERRVEHYGRVAYTNLRFSRP